MSKYYSVKQIINVIKSSVISNFQQVVVYGVLYDIKYHAKSGNFYFKIKEEKDILNCVCWKNYTSLLKPLLQEGLTVELFGNLTLLNSQLVLSIFYIKELTQQVISQQFDYLKQKFLAEDLLAKRVHRIISKYPQRIALITSLDGVVYQDILTVLANFYPCKLIAYDVHMQGINTVISISKALHYFNTYYPESIDFIIIARGGGSKEDLEVLNDEMLARQVFNSKIPVVVAIGHQTDYTILDFVADHSAPTPTASVTFLANKNILYDYLVNYNYWLTKNITNYLTTYRQQLNYLIDKLKHYQYIIAVYSMRLTTLRISNVALYAKIDILRLEVAKIWHHYQLLILTYCTKLQSNIDSMYQQLQHVYYQYIADLAHMLKWLNLMIDNFNVNNVLHRGFAYLSDHNQVIDTIDKFHLNQCYKLHLKDGIMVIKIINK